jgi:hypothetical protein
MLTGHTTNVTDGLHQLITVVMKPADAAWSTVAAHCSGRKTNKNYMGLIEEQLCSNTWPIQP